jgi:lysophospholipase L1-like esterase
VPTTSTSAVEKPTPAKKNALRSFGRGILWFVLICLFFEVALRFFGYGRYVIFRPDERLLWVPMPGKHVTVINHLPETINSQGFRYPETLTLDHPGIYRIFAFGDSVTMGWGVGDDSTYSAQLEKMLNSQGCPNTKFQVISAGVNAYPEALAVERMKETLAAGFKPDAVILAWSFNVGFEVVADLQGADREKFLRRVELKSIARRSAIYNFLIEDLLRDLVYYRLRSKVITGSWDTPAAPSAPPVEHYIKELEEARDLAQANHIPLIMIMFTTKGRSVLVHPYQQAMFDFAKANNIPMVNMIPIFQKQDQNALFPDDLAHPSAAGHTLIAEQLLQVVRGLDSYGVACSRPAATGASDVAAPPSGNSR